MLKGCIYIGHGKSTATGGYDSGAVNNRLGLHEYKIAREIGKYAHEAMQNFKDCTVDLKNYGGDMDLNDRIKDANKCGYDWIVEVHLNANTNVNGKGTEAYYYAGDSVGQAMADNICKQISAGLDVNQRPNWVDDDGGDKVTDYFGIVMKTKPHAVLIETLFITNDAEVQKVTTAAGQQKAGFAIVQGLADAFDLEPKTLPSPVPPKKESWSVWSGHYSTRERAEKYAAIFRNAEGNPYCEIRKEK